MELDAEGGREGRASFILDRPFSRNRASPQEQRPRVAGPRFGDGSSGRERTRDHDSHLAREPLDPLGQRSLRDLDGIADQRRVEQV